MNKPTILKFSNTMKKIAVINLILLGVGIGIIIGAKKDKWKKKKNLWHKSTQTMCSGNQSTEMCVLSWPASFFTQSLCSTKMNTETFLKKPPQNVDHVNKQTEFGTVNKVFVVLGTLSAIASFCRFGAEIIKLTR